MIIKHNYREYFLKNNNNLLFLKPQLKYAPIDKPIAVFLLNAALGLSIAAFLNAAIELIFGLHLTKVVQARLFY